jgi:hypothetical protein
LFSFVKETKSDKAEISIYWYWYFFRTDSFLQKNIVLNLALPDLMNDLCTKWGQPGSAYLQQFDISQAHLISRCDNPLASQV